MRSETDIKPEVTFSSELKSTGRDERRSYIHCIDEQQEQPWNLLFKLDPSPEELEQAARVFAAACWELNNTEDVQTLQRLPGSYDVRTGQEVPGEQGDNTWWVTDGEHRAWVTRYGLNPVPLWSVSVEEP